MVFEDMTSAQLWELRQEISLNSPFIADYANHFNFDEYDISIFFDGYVEYIYELMDDNNSTNFSDYDNEQTLLKWFNCYDDLSWVRCVQQD
jgi:hypothetical protein